MIVSKVERLVTAIVAGTLLWIVPAASAEEAGSLKPKPQEASSNFTVDQVAFLSTPFVQVTGTISCDSTTMATIIVDIRQRAKGQDIGTVGVDDVPCSAGTWSMILRSDAGELGGPQFKPGNAEVVAGALICDAEICSAEEVRTTVRIRP